MNWTAWADMYQPSQHWEPAAYRVRLLKDGKPFPMNRLLGLDKDGLLTIGKTKSMEGRRGQFIYGVKNGTRHSEGNLFHLLLRYSGLKDLFPPKPQIQYRFVPCETEAESVDIEARLLKDYLCRYGELPPLNSAIPNRYDHTTWRLIEDVASARTRK